MMNREKALWRVRPKTEQDDLKDVTHDTLVEVHNATIDEIYDDFEQRTCENCKYKERHKCIQRDNGMMLITSDFGCNRWEVIG